jgi:inositol hexakisphosphate/diphosphoinositol-pentakisphosphate kinase
MGRARKLTIHRVKLPKSFLAVNLSETHTFHKKEETTESKETTEEKAMMAEMETSGEAEGEKETANPEARSETS